jgi:hypothetical protein
MLDAGRMRERARTSWGLKYEIGALIAAKALLLLILYVLFFSSHPQLPEIGKRLFGLGAAP